MLNKQTINKLHELRLTGMAEAFTEQLNQPDMDSLSFTERFGLIVDRQWTWQENNRMDRYLKNARLKLNACVEDIDYKTPRGIDQSVMMNLISCNWVRRHRSGKNLPRLRPDQQGLPGRIPRPLHPRSQVLLSDGPGQGRRKLRQDHQQTCQGSCPGD